MLKIKGDIIIVGDIHVNYHDLLRILKFVSNTPSKVIFLGDYVDRGNFSLECITLLFSFKIIYPEKYYLIRGNHEFDSMCSQYGFKKAILNNHNPKKVENFVPKIVNNNEQKTINLNQELEEETETTVMLCDSYFANHSNIYCYKYTEKLYNAFLDAFSYLPISAIVNNTTFSIHGGLSPQLDNYEKINKFIKRPIIKFDQNQLLTDLLWSDPSPESEHVYCDNPRGRGKLFNINAAMSFLRNNNLQRIIRAHECVKNGIEFHFNNKCITVFSASSYDHDLGNKSGVIQLFEKDDVINSIVFNPFQRLLKFDAFYYKVQSFDNSNVSKLIFSRFYVTPISNLNGVTNQEKSDKKTKFSLKNLNVRIVKQSNSYIKRRSSYFNQPLSFNTGSKTQKKIASYSSSRDASFKVPSLSVLKADICKSSDDDNNSHESSPDYNNNLPFLLKKDSV